MMISKFEDAPGIGGPESIQGFCQQILRSEPIVILASQEDQFMSHMGAWFDSHDEHLGNLCTQSSDEYSVITWESR